MGSVGIRSLPRIPSRITVSVSSIPSRSEQRHRGACARVRGEPAQLLEPDAHALGRILILSPIPAI